MQFLENYPYSLRIMFSLLLISIICYFVNIMVVLYTKAYNMFAIRYQNDQTLRLFLYFWFSQLCIVIPQFVVPFLTNSEGDPTSKDIISVKINYNRRRNNVKFKERSQCLDG